MDSEALKIILNLQKENILLRRAILDAVLMLNMREKYRVLQYDDNDANCLHDEVCKILSLFKYQNKVDNT